LIWKLAFENIQTIKPRMAQFNPKEFVYHYCNGKPAYYSYDEELYCGTFPTFWAENHLPGTGPKHCVNCAIYGSWNGVFIGYCANCAHYEYNGERGRGLIDIGEENNDIVVANFPSIFDIYLKDVSLDDVGDKDFMDTTIEELYQDVDLDEVNTHYDEMSREEECEEECEEVGYYIDRGGYGSNFDGGYDSY
jgi:hypothetical protein